MHYHAVNDKIKQIECKPAQQQRSIINLRLQSK